MKNANLYTAIFMSGFFMLAVVAALVSVWASRAKGLDTAPSAILSGQWASAYEEYFNKALPSYKLSTEIWGTINYTLFKTGNEGVLIGADDWLFTREEFTYGAQAPAQIQLNLDYITDVQKELAGQNIALVVALIPAKARLYQEHLGRYRYPSAQQALYQDVLSALGSAGVQVIDLLKPLRAAKITQEAPLFLPHDTHWSPEGAQISAAAIAQEMDHNIEFSSLGKTLYHLEKSENVDHSGDLMRYIPLGAMQAIMGLEAQALAQWDLIEPTNDGEALSQDALFGDVAIPLALVGTSYSANPLWGFEKFLKNALQSDILNAADEGMGPFEVMRRYLKNEALKTNPPKLVIWEIPERYIPMPERDTSMKEKKT